LPMPDEAPVTSATGPYRSLKSSLFMAYQIQGSS
jgi:hypothetical protein